jgi:ribosomal protein S4
MKYNNLIKNERSKPRLKLSHRIGYSLVNPKKFKKFYKRKWRKFTGFRTPNTTYNPGFQARTSLKNLYGLRLKSKQAFRTSYGKITERQFKNIIRKSEYGKSSSKLNLR